MNESVSIINTMVTKNYLQTQIENQYFERKGLGISEKTILLYINQFVEQDILERQNGAK